MTTWQRPVGQAVADVSRLPGLLAVALMLMVAATLAVQGWQLVQVQRADRPHDGRALAALQALADTHHGLVDACRRAVAAEPGAGDELAVRYAAWVGQLSAAAAAGDPASQADGPDPLAPLQSLRTQADALLGPAAPGAPGPAPLQALLASLVQADAPLQRAVAAGAAQAGQQALRRQATTALLLTLLLGILAALFAAVVLRRLGAALARERQLEAQATQLRAARRDADAANAAKSVFLAHTSHEIRTPFQSLLGMLSLLRESGLTARQTEQVRLATESADHLLTLLNDILDLTQLESGRLTLNPAPLELRALLQQVEGLMRPQAISKSLALHLDAEPAVPEWIVADGTRVKQVLLNLLSNAIKFSSRGSVALDVRIDEGPPQRLAFVVTDTGIGMDATTVARLFQGALPGDGQATRGAGGAGIGLELSCQLARTMGGDISVQSIAGEGSRFRFEIPLQRAARPAQPAAALAAGCEGALRSLSILVAEDHPVNREYLASLLETMRHEAHFVANGLEAVAAVQQRRFDLVLMDLHMPELDGIGATVAIRALPDRAAATVPIVALTADAFQETRDRCLTAGMNDFLAKPVSPANLASALRRLYGHEAADATPAMAASATVQAPPLPDASLVDRGALEAALAALPADRLRELIFQYLDQGPQTVARLRAAVRDGQPLELRVHAHAACGAALTLGLAALAQTAQALHEGAAHLPAHEIAHLVQRFEDLLPRTRAAVQASDLLRR
jgi:signal transduction histidine kinase/DNA-binding NarL/FixJ family response regulator/HPt (histidine-containing phosphotransfer) domain-containing protein